MTHAVNPVLRRKAGSDRPEPEYGHMTGPKALRLAVSRAAQIVLQCPLTAGEISQRVVTVGTVAKLVPEGALSVLLRTDKGPCGLLVLDQVALRSILEAQTTGRVSEESEQPRAPTATDAMLSRQFNTLLLKTVSELLRELPSTGWPYGVRPDIMVDHLRQLPHLLEDVGYNLFQLPLDVSNGARSAHMSIMVPRAVIRAPEPEAGSDCGTEWEDALERRIMDSSTVIEATLHRFSLPLSEVSAFQPGARLRFPARALQEVTLESAEGDLIGLSRLGQTEGFKAVRLNGDPKVANMAEGAHDSQFAVPDAHDDQLVPLRQEQPGTELVSAIAQADALPDPLDAHSLLDDEDDDDDFGPPTLV